ncbi:MAG: heme exporter protein CcmB [Bacteroidia bacterium]|nr:heme exporter protein CcmB [Bacteroidia bacterium]
MSLFSEIRTQLELELRLESRNKFAMYSILLYVSGTVFICYLSFLGNLNAATWNALFWIILLFSAIQAASKSFLNQSRGNFIYHYSLLSPQALIVSKTIYNIGLMLVVALSGLLFFSIFLSNPVQDHVLYLISILLGAMGFASVLSMVSAIASRSGNNVGLMSVLSFPLLLPLLLTCIRLSKNAMDGLDWSVSYKLLIILLALNSITWVLSYLLFPYLWRE